VLASSDAKHWKKAIMAALNSVALTHFRNYLKAEMLLGVNGCTGSREILKGKL
jgi:hypothetical protein